MQRDFHYDAVYVLARCAGLSPSASLSIATSSQYVDEAVERDLPRPSQGFGILPDVTAHRVSDLIENTDTEDQRRVWVPFHFLPGAEGDTQSERLICRKDGAVAQAVVRHAIEECRKPFGLELVGVTAHAYADTFAHWGFSGVSSRWNRVRPGSVALANESPQASAFFTPLLHRLLAAADARKGNLIPNFRSAVTGAANLGSLGHAAVATSPDQPFLAWSFEYEPFPDIPARAQDRFNTLDYLAAAEKLHAFFVGVRQRRVDPADGPGIAFDSIRGAVLQVLATVGDSASRSAAWKAAAAAGKFGTTGGVPEFSAAGMDTSRNALADWRRGDEAVSQPAYRFYQAATRHRWFVLRDLLPEHGIVLI